jgi:RNA polymerase sigma factor (sigma-70 family)
MTTSPLTGLLGELRRVALGGHAAARTDADLLGEFIARRDGTAFEALLARHGPMVLGVCRRVLGNHHDAEDAFQATFLVLARKAASVVPRARVGNWLYGVAYHTALKARAVAARRRAKERRVGQMPRSQAEDGPGSEVLALLDEELHGLPDNYRAPLVLCELEGRTHQEAARLLGWPVGTLSGRLWRARELLARRLRDRGLHLSTAALATFLATTAVRAAVPTSLARATARAVALLSSGSAVPAGVVPSTVAVLTEGVLKTMLLKKLAVVSGVFLALAVLTGLAGVLGPSVARMGVPPPAAAAPAPSADLRRARMEAWQIDPWILRHKVVQKEVEATRDQMAKVEGLFRRLQARYQPEIAKALANHQQGNKAAFEQALARFVDGHTREMNAALPRLFKPAQVARLCQIDLQWRGAEAFVNPRLVKALGLSAAQRKKARGIVAKARRQVTDLGRNVKPSSEEDAVAALRRIYRSATQAFVKGLTPSQKRAWRTLTGAPLRVQFGHNKVSEGP